MEGEIKGLKNDRLDNKLMWELLPIEYVEEIVNVLTKGANKYGPNCWQNLNDGIDRYYAALLRHLVSWRKGENVDEDTKCRHLAQVACNCIFLMHLTNKKQNGN